MAATAAARTTKRAMLPSLERLPRTGTERPIESAEHTLDATRLRLSDGFWPSGQVKLAGLLAVTPVSVLTGQWQAFRQARTDALGAAKLQIARGDAWSATERPQADPLLRPPGSAVGTVSA